ncbi:AlpA family phage regulatory protein [Primorskyibacter aestuariivivens]|uniref:helix-turn-helix transcriptional regulator n=1 Tax=Primorskyibacter aestuariivivens TaxID=1888912 RepID=UPI0023003658|nr:AlpA family phage regulatory protein [Primorskyibacter aestuariivivens]MDA7430277.1 AlpA family phage regulatory protein [Primorskyibacter aestuariivivens]
MRILSKRQVKELVLYSPQHTRLEKAGQFPKRVQLGSNRVGWVEDEVLECRV